MRLTPILAFPAISGAVLCAAGCERRVTAPPPPVLWRIDAMEGGHVVKTVDICADRAVVASFLRPAPELNGKPCLRVGQAVQTAKGYSVRCRIDGAIYRVGANQTGDPSRDFTVDMAVTRQDRHGPVFEQTRRYRRLGPCPTGWRIGDTAAPGDRRVVNALAAREGKAP